MEKMEGVPSTWSCWNDNVYNIIDLKLSSERESLNKLIENELEEEITDVDVESEEESKEIFNILDATYQKVEKYNREPPFFRSTTSSACVSAKNSSYTAPSSLPESIDGGFAEIEELKALPPTTDTCLKINLALQRRFSSVLDRLQKALKENDIRMNILISKEKILDEKIYESDSKKLVKPSHFAFPYFKDRFGSHAPMNEETTYKIEQNYLDLYTTRARTWLTSERQELVEAVISEYKTNKVNESKTKLREIERKISHLNMEDDPEVISQKLEELLLEKNEVENNITYYKDVAGIKVRIPEDYTSFDWDKIAATVFDGYRQPEECRLQWINYMHTDINKEPFTENEDIYIQKEVKKLESSSKKPNWEEIANSLGSERTPFQVMQRYVSFIKPSLEPAKWTDEAAQNLINTVNLLRVGNHIPWTQVSHHLLKYTPTQIQSKWRTLNPEYKNKRFDLDEDFTLVKGIYMFGLNWTMINHFLPGRTKVQIRDRFKKALLPGLLYKPWKAKQDKKILENISANASNWRKLAGMLRRKRDGCELRLRYVTIQFWQDSSGQKCMPPPLFPLDATTNVQKINFLRERLKTLDMSRYQIMDEILVKGQMDKVDEALLTGAPKEEGSDSDKDCVKLKSYRRRIKKTKIASWPDRATLEFFLPNRVQEWVGAHDPYDHKLYEVSHALSKLLQIKLDNCPALLNCLNNKVPLTEYEGIKRGDLGYLEKLLQDSSSIESLNQKMPLLPPCSTTVGALRSLLLQKDRLIEMANNSFLFYNVPSSQFSKLGEKERQLVFKEPDYESNIEDAEDSNSNETVEEPPTKRRRVAAKKALYYNKVIAKEAHYEDVTKAAIFNPTEDEKLDMITGQELESNHYLRSHLTSRNEIIKKEDQLLFNRLMSLFFWPSVLTEISPSEELISSCNRKNEKLSELCDQFNELSDDEEVIIRRKATRRKRNEQQLKDLSIPQLKDMINCLENNIPIQTSVSNTFQHTEEDEEMNNFIIKSKVEHLEDKNRLKKHIISLKRRLVTKSVWEQRKNGKRPKRRPRGKGRVHSPVPTSVKTIGVRKSTRKAKRKHYNTKDLI